MQEASSEIRGKKKEVADFEQRLRKTVEQQSAAQNRMDSELGKELTELREAMHSLQ